MSDFNQLQARLGYTFANTELLRLALTHPSVAHEQGAGVQHNQRLEFLGDSVLGMVLSRELYEKFSDKSEGPLTKARAQLVNRRTLAEQGRKLQLGDHLFLSKGEEASGGRGRESAVADAFEALLGAVFLDGGYEVARVLILRLFAESFGELNPIPNLENPKGELQERLQATSNEPPQYELVGMTGPDHDRVFEALVRHAGLELGRGSGKSKKAAESEAAMCALRRLMVKAEELSAKTPPEAGGT